jgi:hypothetical protein
MASVSVIIGLIILDARALGPPITGVLELARGANHLLTALLVTLTDRAADVVEADLGVTLAGG